MCVQIDIHLWLKIFSNKAIPVFILIRINKPFNERSALLTFNKVFKLDSLGFSFEGFVKFQSPGDTGFW